ncbi:MAG: hypothetical protein ACD_73C00161G0002 [uncultured bacterium]|nr:MAG: hypothetical protein ACD_73C00161G0002 [uncultured bacterium]
MQLTLSQWGMFQYDMQAGPLKTKKHVLETLGKQLKRDQPDFIVLPEMWLGGPANLKERPDWVHFYQESQKELCQLAKAFKKNILASGLSLTKKRHTNSAFFINEKGLVIHTYHKIHLFTFGGEGKIFDLPPVRIAPFTHRGIKIAQIICYDLRFPELARSLTHLGLHILVVHAQWPEARRDHWLTLLKARAIENQIYVVAVNRLGTKKDDIFCGDSIMVNPWGEIILSHRKNSEWEIAGMDLNFLHETRKKYPFLKERRFKKITWK